MPVPLMTRAIVPAPFWITPLKVVEPLVGVNVSVAGPVLLLVTVPPLPLRSDREATV